MMRSVRIPYFRIWYSSVFIFLFLATLILTVLTPADLVYQSIRSDTFPNIFSVGGAYLLTLLICAFIWSSRLYTNRVVLREIPKSFIPVDYGEVPRKVYKMIRRQWERSALVAWDSRPRNVQKELEEDAVHRRSGEGYRASGQFRRRKSRTRETIIIPPETAISVWGAIAHPGWSSPQSEDLPNLQYSQVIQELPNLIEAKAVSLAPPDPDLFLDGLAAQNMATIPDARVAALLQRPQAMGMRDYLMRLSLLCLINPPTLASTFLALYEYARFSTKPLTEPEFRELMAVFASILAGMTSLDLSAVEDALEELSDRTSASARSMAPSVHSSDSALHDPNEHDDTSSDSVSLSIANQRTRPRLLQRTSSTGTVLTAPSRFSQPRTVQQSPSVGSLGSEGSFARTRTNLSAEPSSSSSASLRSARSVIRLTPEPRQPGELPYQINIPGD